MTEHETFRKKQYREYLRLERELADYLYASLIDHSYPGGQTMEVVAKELYGHRVLCVDIPEHLVVINRASKTLDRLDYRAWFLKVVWDRHLTGVEVTNRERASALKMNISEFKGRIRRARRRIRASIKRLTH